VLFDIGATHSFINLKLVEKLAYDLEEMNVQLGVTSSVGSVYYIGTIFRDRAISING